MCGAQQLQHEDGSCAENLLSLGSSASKFISRALLPLKLMAGGGKAACCVFEAIPAVGYDFWRHLHSIRLQFNHLRSSCVDIGNVSQELD